MKRIIVLRLLSIIIVVIGIFFLIKYLRLDKKLSTLKATKKIKECEKFLLILIRI